MASNDYHFISRWRLRATPQEVCDVLSDATSLPRWWPALYQSAEELTPGDENGVGKVLAIGAQAGLPYTLKFQFRITESDAPNGYALEAWGDLDGEGRWTFVPDGDWCDIEYDWRVRATKPLLRWGSFLLKPAFAWNHSWSMAKGEESLALEILRRRAQAAGDEAEIPSPPPAVRLPFVKLAVALFAGFAVVSLIRRRR